MAASKKTQSVPDPEIDDSEAQHADDATGEIIDAETEDIPFEVADDDTTPARPTAILSFLPSNSDMTTWTEEQAALLDAAGLVQRKNGQAPSWAPRATIAAFLQQCARTGLDPIARQIYCIERAGKWTIQISIDGARLIAHRTREYRGQTPAQWTADGITWVDVWLSKEPPAAAKVGVYREGFVEPLVAVARWDSYAVYTTDYRTKAQKPAAMWAKMPDVMLSKVAEMLALRKAFPQDLSGLYSTEEMEQAGTSTSAQPALTALANPGTEIAPTPATNTNADGEASWAAWRKAIDACTDVDQLTAVRQQAADAGILNFTVPGQTYRVGDYFETTRSALAGEPPEPVKLGSVAERMAAGLKTDATVGVGA